MRGDQPPRGVPGPLHPQPLRTLLPVQQQEGAGEVQLSARPPGPPSTLQTGVHQGHRVPRLPRLCQVRWLHIAIIFIQVQYLATSARIPVLEHHVDQTQSAGSPTTKLCVTASMDTGAILQTVDADRSAPETTSALATWPVSGNSIWYKHNGMIPCLSLPDPCLSFTIFQIGRPLFPKEDLGDHSDPREDLGDQ